jgi:aspartokinase/homoserine dehydrogenase 1
MCRSASGIIRKKESIFKGLTSVDSLALFNLEGVGMMGVPGIATRLFAALHKEQANVIFIAQASSEHSICFAIPASQAVVAKASIEEAFFKELHYGHISPITHLSPVSVIAMVGDNMTNTVGVSGLLFSSLGGASVNVLAISQGSSQRNISAVVLETDAPRALQAIHDKMIQKEEE